MTSSASQLSDSGGANKHHNQPSSSYARIFAPPIALSLIFAPSIALSLWALRLVCMCLILARIANFMEDPSRVCRLKRISPCVLWSITTKLNIAALVPHPITASYLKCSRICLVLLLRMKTPSPLIPTHTYSGRYFLSSWRTSKNRQPKMGFFKTSSSSFRITQSRMPKLRIRFLTSFLKALCFFLRVAIAFLVAFLWGELEPREAPAASRAASSDV
mmetsp:Transcript_33336/g.65491  ORF Transcript_33336/g.65491 Transcript_33336/m.65491 type:complete len:217 (+) Transcript_33336:723-1373(+)